MNKIFSDDHYNHKPCAYGCELHGTARLFIALITTWILMSSF